MCNTDFCCQEIYLTRQNEYYTWGIKTDRHDRYNWNIDESGVKHHKPKPKPKSLQSSITNTMYYEQNQIFNYQKNILHIDQTTQ